MDAGKTIRQDRPKFIAEERASPDSISAAPRLNRLTTASAVSSSKTIQRVIGKLDAETPPSGYLDEIGAPDLHP